VCVFERYSTVSALSLISVSALVIAVVFLVFIWSTASVAIVVSLFTISCSLPLLLEKSTISSVNLKLVCLLPSILRPCLLLQFSFLNRLHVPVKRWTVLVKLDHLAWLHHLSLNFSPCVIPSLSIWWYELTHLFLYGESTSNYAMSACLHVFPICCHPNSALKFLQCWMLCSVVLYTGINVSAESFAFILKAEQVDRQATGLWIWAREDWRETASNPVDESRPQNEERWKKL
jgi:hypothetical protein